MSDPATSEARLPVVTLEDRFTAQDPCRQLLTSFCGVPMGQIWADLYLWEMLLNAHPELRAIVEIGTWQGGFSRYLAAQARERGLAFHTFDAIAPERPPEGFRRLDVFASPGVVGEYFRWCEPLILLCDGGNKPRELKTFAPYLDAGSLVVVHDWLTEIQPEDVPGELRMVYEPACEALGSMSRVFEVE